MVIRNCLSCDKKNLVRILSLGNLYLSDFIEEKDLGRISKYPLDLILCNNCYLLQIKDVTPAEKLYTENYGYYSGINQTMRDELADIVKKAVNIVPIKKGDIVLDIGCNDGTLLKYYGNYVTKVGFDPVNKFEKYFKKKNEVFINNYFDSKKFLKKFLGKKTKIITAISMFYDLKNPNMFLEDIKACLDSKGIFVIQQNYLGKMLELNAFDNIVHEHIEYYSLLSLKNLLERHGLEITDVFVNSINGGSFRTFISLKGRRKPTFRVLKVLKEEEKQALHTKAPYFEFSKRIKHNMDKLSKFIKAEVKKGKHVYTYGASTRGNTLLQYTKLNNKLIEKAVERNPEKWGKIIASVGIPIISEEQARKEKPDYMLVLPWFFKKEFLKREKKYIKEGGHFIFPLPEFEII